jgi:DHA2 family multidrug resistance protein
VLTLFVYSIVTQVAPMLENLFGYSVMLTGLVTAPRGAGAIVSMVIAGRLTGRGDVRIVMSAGLVVCAIASLLLAHINLLTDTKPIIFAGFVQGLGAGLIFVPVTAIAFSTLNPLYRNEASALHTLLRSIGGTVGVSALQVLTIRNAATVQSRLVEGVRPDNPNLTLRAPDFDFHDPGAVAGMIGHITQQAWMVAYTDTFWLLAIISVAMWPFVLLLRQAKGKAMNKAEPLALE